jgi:hypothetical protein
VAAGAQAVIRAALKAPRVRETVVQRQIVKALAVIGATVYEIGRPPHRDDTNVHKGLRQSPGVPDLCVHMPVARYPIVTRHTEAGDESMLMPPHTLWIEVKAVGGTLSEAQKGFRDFCLLADEPHIVGGLDEVLAYLQHYGYVKETAYYRQMSLSTAKPEKRAHR